MGSLIAGNQWSILQLLALGFAIITLYFSEFRYLIFCTMLVFLVANSQYESITVAFGTLRWIFLTTMAVVAISHWILGRVPTRVRAVDLWVCAFLTLAFYSGTYSILPSLTLERSVATVIFYWAVFWGVWSYVQDEMKIPVIIHDLLKISFPVFFVGFTLIGGDRFFGIFGSPNSIGVFSAILAPLAFWSYLCEKKKSALFLLLLMGISLFLSKSRAGITSTVIASAYFLALYRRERLPIIVLGLLFFLVCSFLYVEMFGSSLFQEYFRWETLATGGGRLEAWKEVVRLIMMRPWLGYGFGTEDQLFLKFDIAFFEHAGAYVHNSYIGLISQLGLIGACLFFIPLILFFLRRTYQVNRMPSGNTRWLALALNASIFGGLVNAVFESWLYAVGNSFTFPFWINVILAYRLVSLSRTEAVSGAQSE
ncbi:MAG: O-antigen ligase family protein [Candidatus Omnitrophica bacterium]|nr:O-antigen ligase family protein [Candidatus Omnitrophota bacterium]